MIKECIECRERFKTKSGYNRELCFECEPASLPELNPEMDNVLLIFLDWSSHSDWSHYPGILPFSNKVGQINGKHKTKIGI